jgi:predicted nucleotidyltransferase
MAQKKRFTLNVKMFEKLLNGARNQFKVELNGELYIVPITKKSYFTSEKFIAMHELNGAPEILDYRDIEKATIDGDTIKFRFHRKNINRILKLLWLD